MNTMSAEVVGRQTEVDRLLVSLRMHGGTVPLVVAPQGTGKSSVARALAQRLKALESGPLAGYSLRTISGATLLKEPDPVEAFQIAVDEERGKAVVFLDDLEAVMMSGPSGNLNGEFLTALRPIAQQPDTNIIITLAKPYDALLRANYPELWANLDLLELAPLSDDQVRRVASLAATWLARFHSVEIPDQAIVDACRPPTPAEHRVHPGLAVHRLDQAAAQAAQHGRQVATVTLGVTAPSFDPKAVSEGLRRRIKGQDTAIDQVVNRLTLTRAGLDLQPVRPDGVFMFAGPTGTGKTAFALALAEEIFGSQDAVIRVDMSEYRERHAAARLIGPPPGYKGSDRPEQWLTTKVLNQPHCVLLLDEFEKAHPSVWETFLQVFDSGTLTDGQGQQADFRDTIIIATSNIGSSAFSDSTPTGFALPDAAPPSEERAVLRAIEEQLAPELVARFSSIIVFKPLELSTVLEIAGAELSLAAARLEARGVRVKLDGPVIAFIADRGYSRRYGVRPLQKTIEELVLLPASQLSPGDYQVKIDAETVSFLAAEV